MIELHVKLIDLSRKQDVGLTSIYLEIGPFKIVIDAGMHPKETGLNAIPDFKPVRDGILDYIILTHCHLDHLGSLPILKRRQLQAPILCSMPSRILAGRMLRNSVKIMNLQRDELNIKEYPLYTSVDVDAVERDFYPINFQERRVLHKDGEELAITFYDSGHVTGAIGLLLEYKHRKLFFTGDVLFEEQASICGANFPDDHVDVIIVETTRGAHEREIGVTRESEVKRLIETIQHTLHRGGSCLIPVFALGRMQEMLSIFHEHIKKGELTHCPIFCSGLGVDLVDYFDTIAKKTGLVKFRKKIYTQLKASPLRADLRPGEDPKEKGIYLLSSGMLVEKTPSYLAAASMVEHHSNSICFVGYCDPDTPGGKLLHTKEEDLFSFDSLGYHAKVRARIEKFDISGHADREDLMKFLRTKDPRAIVLSHGEAAARKWFEDELAIECPKIQVINPIPGEEYLL